MTEDNRDQLLEVNPDEFNQANPFTASFAVLASQDQYQPKNEKNLNRLKNLKLKPTSKESSLTAAGKGSIEFSAEGFAVPTQDASSVPVSSFNSKAPEIVEPTLPSSNSDISTTPEASAYPSFNFPDLSNISYKPPAQPVNTTEAPESVSSELFSLGPVSDSPPNFNQVDLAETSKTESVYPTVESKSKVPDKTTNLSNSFVPSQSPIPAAESNTPQEIEEVLSPKEIIKDSIIKLKNQELNWEGLETILNETRYKDSLSVL